LFARHGELIVSGTKGNTQKRNVGVKGVQIVANLREKQRVVNGGRPDGQQWSGLSTRDSRWRNCRSEDEPSGVALKEKNSLFSQPDREGTTSRTRVICLIYLIYLLIGFRV
jgi:hypothetical protein